MSINNTYIGPFVPSSINSSYIGPVGALGSAQTLNSKPESLNPIVPLK